MIEITNLRQGALLNHNHGKESENALEIKIQGIVDSIYTETEVTYEDGRKGKIELFRHSSLSIVLVPLCNISK